MVTNILEKHAVRVESEIKFLENKLEHRIVHRVSRSAVQRCGHVKRLDRTRAVRMLLEWSFKAWLRTKQYQQVLLKTLWKEKQLARNYWKGKTVEIQKRLEAVHLLTYITQKLCLQKIIQPPLYGRSELVPVMILRKNTPHMYEYVCHVQNCCYLWLHSKLQ